MVDLYEYNNIDENDLIEQIKLNDENLTDEQINAYFNNRYTPQEYTFTIEIMADHEIKRHIFQIILLIYVINQLWKK